MTETKKRPDYTTRQVRKALEDYVILADGKQPTDGLADPDYGVRIQKSRNLEAPFIKPIIKKADLDRAIQALKPMQRSIIITIDIAGFDYSEVGYWFDKDYFEINQIEQYSIRCIKRFLNDPTNKGKLDNSVSSTIHNDTKTTKKGFYEIDNATSI